MSEQVYNVAGFRLEGAADTLPDSPDRWKEEVLLQIDGKWTRRAGTQPDINSALVTYVEFEKIFKDATAEGTSQTVGDETPATNRQARLRGKIRFYYSSLAAHDYEIRDLQIVQVDEVQRGFVPGPNPGDAPVARVVMYRLFFADFRHRLQPPRGGRLLDGDVNPDPPKEDDVSPALLTNQQMIQKCIAALGIEATVPASVNDVLPMRNLQWFGAHPIEELSKLLAHTGHVFCPTSDPSLRIQKIGEGNEPSVIFTRELPSLALQGIDRRGQTIVVTSYPTPVIDSFDENVSTNYWSYVSQNQAGEWVNVDDNALYGSVGSVVAHASKFANVARRYKQQLVDQTFRCIRLDTSKFPPNLCPVLNKVVRSVGNTEGPYRFKVSAVKIFATIARREQDGRWRNTPEQVEVAVHWKAAGNIFIAAEKLIILDEGGDGVEDPDAFALPAFDTKVLFSVEAIEEGNTLKRYFYTGFRIDLTDTASPTVKEITADEAKGIVAAGGGESDDAIILSMPELRYIRTNGAENDQLKTQLIAAAKAKAEPILVSASEPVKHRTLAGFAEGEISGRVSEIEYDQAGITTTFKINAWYMPPTALRRDDLERLKSGAFPGQHQTNGSRTYLGGSGEVQPSLPIMPPPPTQLNSASANLELFRLVKDGGSAGTQTTLCTYTYKVFERDANPATATPIKTQVPLTGMGNRIVKAAVLTPASYGVGWRTSSGVVLVWADESYLQTNC